MSVFELQFDFTAEKGGFLLVDRDPAWSRTDLISLEVQMLQHNKIPRLLPVHIEEMDGRIRLLFDIQGKKRLTDRLRRESLTQRQYLNMLLNAVSALADCEGYMLGEDRLLLQAEYLFTGADITDMYFPFVPVVGHSAEKSIQDRLKGLSALCLGSVESMAGTSVPRILAALREDTMRLPELKELLLTLMLEHPAAATETPRGSSLPGANSIAPDSIRPAWIPVINPVEEEKKGNGESPKRLSWLTRIREMKDEIDMSGETGLLPDGKGRGDAKVESTASDAGAVSDRKKQLYLAVIAVAVLALTWSFYSEVSSTTGFVVMAGISGGVVIGIGWTIKTRPAWLFGNSSAKGELDTGAAYLEAAPSFDALEVDVGETSRSVWNPPPSFSESAGASQAPARLPTATVVLEPSVIEAALGSLGGSLAYRLDITVDGRTESVQLTKESFLIGRSDGRADYTLEESGVSKHHLELIRRGNAYFAQDLGSTNGTLLNGERMAPYKAYPLSPEDTLRVIRTQFLIKQE
ncbi:DUF6382 domain-containing protein [Paenibacillus sp. HJGM_3]|uniref:DUF6382 domain-containing protein n=1 Tax=Paenibacillus sp. HJGM_3 TaxID=3379816 RepID=UPI00385D633A